MEGFLFFATILMLSSLASANSIDRIKGGKQASRQARDFQGLAFIEKATIPTHSKICSVVLVDANWVLAPRSCELGDGTEIYFGLTRWCSGESYQFDAGYEQRTVKQIVERKRTAVTPRNVSHPLILAQLNNPITETQYIRYAYLPMYHPRANEMFTVTGWGQTEERGKMSCVLREAPAKVLSDRDCKDSQGKETIRKDEVCVRTEGNKEAACDGDIGAPLYKENGVYGVMISERRCGFGTYPQIYGTTDTEIEWIRATIKEQTGGSIWVG